MPDLRRVFRSAVSLIESGYLPRIADLKVATVGTDPDGVPFIVLASGRSFFGYAPSQAERFIYRYLAPPRIRRSVPEEAFGVASAIARRYLAPKSRRARLKDGKFYDFSEGQTIVEVGAFTGYYALRAAELVGSEGRVVAIEAAEENVAILRKNISANEMTNISVAQVAAWDSRGTLSFHRKDRQLGSAIREVIQSDHEVVVACDTVDNVLGSLEVFSPDFIRVQVNGAEERVLSGMPIALERCPAILVAAPYEVGGSRSVDVVDQILRTNGYATSRHRRNVLGTKSRRLDPEGEPPGSRG